ncbi:MAG: hypothetical protein M0P76_05730 [Candidatus Pacebacteria bacterium]|jgi:hypothetical protein|nr:hypothetical protein [Candidatus Paceibacterota bacterium]
MKDWSFAINSLYKTGHIDIEEGPWYAFVAYVAVEWICDTLPAIPLPEISIQDEDGYDTTLKDYYGDVQQLWHLKVCMPVFQWAEGKKHTTRIEMPYKKIRELFYETNRSFFDEEESLSDEDV